MRSKLIGLLITTLLLVAILVPGCEGEGEPATDFYIPYINIESGPTAGGQAVTNWAFLEMVEMINEGGGVHGHNLTVTTYDTGGDPATAHTKMVGVLANDPLIVIDMTNPQCVDAWKDLVIDDEYLAAAAVTGDTAKAYRPWILKLEGPTANKGALVMEPWITDAGNITKICPIPLSDFVEIKNDWWALCEDALDDIGVNYTASVDISLATSDWNSVALEALATGADAFAILTIGFQAANVLIALQNHGFVENNHVFFIDFADDNAFQALAGNISTGCYVMSNINHIDCNSVLYQQLESRWNDTHPGEEIDKIQAIRGADMALWVSDGLYTSGVTNDPAVRAAEREDLRAALYNVPDFGSICGYAAMECGVMIRDCWLIQMGFNNARTVVERIAASLPSGYGCPSLP